MYHLIDAPLGLRKHPRGAIEQRITKDQWWCSVLSSTGESWVMSLPSPSTVSLPVVTCGSSSLGLASLDDGPLLRLSLIHISEPTRLGMISYAVFCLKKKK